jgi:hypothetical protein
MTDTKDARIAELEARILELETVTEEKVERAAKAFYNNANEGIIGWHEVEERYRSTYREPIRAALMAGR